MACVNSIKDLVPLTAGSLFSDVHLQNNQ